MQRGEWQLHLGLRAGDPRQAESRRLPSTVVQQGRLADARLAADHEDRTAVGAGLLEEPAKHLALSSTAQQARLAPPAQAWHQAAVSSGEELGNALKSKERDRIPSFAKTLCGCPPTVRGLRKGRPPISGFENPSRANRAICRSCAVSSARASGVGVTTCSPVARSSLRARSANPSIPIELNWSWAARSWARASARRCSRRSHSP